MNRSVVMRPRRVAAVVLAAAISGVALGQDFREAPANLPFDTVGRMKDMKSGKRPTIDSGDPNATKANRKDLTATAEHLVYRLTHPQYHEVIRVSPTDKSMSRLISEADQYILTPDPNRKLTDAQYDYIREFGKVMGEKLKEVLTHPKLIVRVNAGRLLANVCKSGCEELADLCVAILEDKDQIDAIRLFALEGLKYLFTVTNPETQTRSVFRNAERERKTIAALIEFLNRPPTVNEKSPPEEVDAFRYVRREAVRALGQVRHNQLKDFDKILSRPGWWLLKVALKDGLTPEPSVSERAEAVIGFLQLSPEDLSVDYAVYHAGWAIVELARELLQAQQAGTAEAVLPWRVASFRLTLALNAWKASFADVNLPDASKRLAAEFVDQAVGMLQPIVSEGAKANPGRLQTLEGWVRNHAPKSASLYTTGPEALLKIPAAAGN